MKQIKLSITLCTVVLMMSQCRIHPEINYSIRIKNNYNTDIFYHYNFSPVEKENDVIYPDTTISFVKDCLVRVKQGSTFIDNMPLHPIEKWISDLPQDTLSIYIFDKDTLNKYEWNEIQRYYKVLIRYDLSVDDVKLLKEEIPYPPTEMMKGMKMYPLFGQ